LKQEHAMTDRTKLFAAGTMLVIGAGLIAWNSRDPDRAFREPPRQKENVAIDQVPSPVQATIRRESARARVKEIQKKTRQGKSSYEADIVRGDLKTTLKIAADGAILQRETKKLKPSKTM
jgi:hypothetical protein